MVVEPAVRDSKHCIVDLNEKSDTLVILFGWAGCKDRYLTKYSQIYKDAGVSTIRYTAPIEKVRSFETYQHWAKYFYKHSIGKGVHIPDKVYIQSFSMNGCSLLTAFWDYLETLENGEKFKQKVSGMLFDSAPAFTTPSQSARAVSLATLPPANFHPALRESYRALLYTFFTMQSGVMWVRSFAESDIYVKSFAYCRMLNMEDLPVKQLFLYGPGDVVCSAESIEAFAESQKCREKEVVLERMENSEHVAHYRTHPDRYRASCLRFIGIDPSQPGPVEEVTVTPEVDVFEEEKVAQMAQ